MTQHSQDEINAFFNALQLSINETFLRSHREDTIFFGKIKPKDPRIKLIEKLLPGQWDSKPILMADILGDAYHIHDFNNLDLTLLTDFLILTRLNKENIIALIKKDSRFQPFAEKLSLELKNKTSELIAPQDFGVFLTKSLQEKSMTLRELSEKTGLTQLTLSKIKSGTDTKISSILKITKALGKKVFLE